MSSLTPPASRNIQLRTTGAWLVHHSQKLEHFKVDGFGRVILAGKAAVLLSALAASDQMSLDNAKVDILARASGIDTTFQLPRLLQELKERELINVSASGVDVFGVTGATVLQRGAEIFAAKSPTNMEEASIALAEMASQSPVRRSETLERIGDIHKLSSVEMEDFLGKIEATGLVDSEDLGGDRVYFNANLFHRGSTAKVDAVLSSLNATERELVTTVDEQLRRSGCMAVDDVKKVLGEQLFLKLNAIAMYDVSVVNNTKENIGFITRPAAFSKYGNGNYDDALDLAKAFVSSLTYGMTRSDYRRGQITMAVKLVAKLNRGEWVGPVDAIGEDYRALELKRVVEVRKGKSYGWEMRLLKRDVGDLALRIIQDGDASDVPLLKLPGANVTSYTGPEVNRVAAREVVRKKDVTGQSAREIRNMVMSLRTGGAKT